MESSFLHPTKVLQAAGITDGMHVADFGVGSGFFTRAAARLVGPSGVVWAIDIQRDLLPRIKNLSLGEHLSNVEVVWGDITLPQGSHLHTHSCDSVLLTNVLFMLEEKRAVLKEMARVLKSSGRAVLVDWTSSHGGLGPHPDHVITEQEARVLCEHTGFVVERSVPAGAYHWGLIIRKKEVKEAQ